MINTSTEWYKAQQKFLQTQSDLIKKHSDERKTINILSIGCSTTNMDDEIRRIPSSHKIMNQLL